MSPVINNSGHRGISWRCPCPNHMDLIGKRLERLAHTTTIKIEMEAQNSKNLVIASPC